MQGEFCEYLFNFSVSWSASVSVGRKRFIASTPKHCVYSLTPILLTPTTEISGFDVEGFEELDLDGEFDPEEHDAKLNVCH